MQGRQRRELIGGLAFQYAGEHGDRRRRDVVVPGQHPGRGHRVQPEHDQADDVARNQGVAVQAERRHPPPDQQQPDGPGHRALQRYVEPGCRDARGRVDGQPVVHLLGNRAAELAADGDDDCCVPEPGQRRPRTEAVHGVQPPQQQPHRNDLRVTQAAVTGHERPQAGGETPPGAARQRRDATAGGGDIRMKRGAEPLSGGDLRIILRLSGGSLQINFATGSRRRRRWVTAVAPGPPEGHERERGGRSPRHRPSGRPATWPGPGRCSRSRPWS